LLEKFEKIYLWMDDDVPGREGAEKFAKKLGPDRCLIVRPNGSGPSPKDANEALLSKINMRELIENATPLPHKEILTFSEVRHELRHQLANPMQAAGKQFSTLPSMNAILKGHRRGELTVITGPTGAGKTTFLSQVSLDLCNQGVNTLWGSFEIKNIQLMKKMLMQYAGNPNVLHDDMFEHVADGFESLPMYFMRFYGSTDIDEVLDAMEYAVYVYDVEHILLDNLQFMLSSSMSSKSGFERFEAQERALEQFRRFATEKNVHLSLVIHPRKEQDDALLNINSVFGTAKATQEADNVLILQKVDGNKLIDIRKNRFDGDLGRFQIMFDGDTHLYRDELSDGLSTIGDFDGGADDERATVAKKEGGNSTEVVLSLETTQKEEKKTKELTVPTIDLDEIIMS
jgi:twinkle protein